MGKYYVIKTTGFRVSVIGDLNILVNTGSLSHIADMSVAAEKVAEVLALPVQDRAYLAHQLIASLDGNIDADAETQWNEVIDRRSHEIEDGKVNCRPPGKAVREIRAKLNARRQPS
jgi:putative addiction module component (TIGR02574 family)